MSYLLLGVFFYALNNVLWSYYAKEIEVFHLISKRAIFTTLYIVIAYAIFFDNGSIERLQQFGFELVGVSLIGFFGLLLLVKGFKYGSLVQFCVYTLISTLIVGLISAYYNFLEAVDIFIGVLIVIAGYILYMFSQFREVIKNDIKIKSHLYFILAHTLFIILIFTQWNYLKHVTILDMILTQELVVLLGSAILIFITNKKGSSSKNNNWKLYALLAIPITLAQLTNLNGLKITNPFIERLVGLSEPSLSLIIGYLLFKQPVKRWDVLSFIIMLLGLYFLEI